MKKALVLLLLLALFLIFADRLNNDKAPAPKPPAAQATPAMPRADTPAELPPTPEPRRIGPEVTPVPAGQPVANDIESRLRAIAQRTNVRITGYLDQGSQVSVRVEWTGDVATWGGDFVGLAVREGVIRDFDSGPDHRRWVDKDLRSQWLEDFVLKK